MYHFFIIKKLNKNQKTELSVLDLIEPIVHIYFIDNKKAPLPSNSWVLCITRGKYETKPYS